MKMKTTKKELVLFLAMAYGITILMALPLGICQRSGADVNVFPVAQMFYPAAGVALAMLVTRWRDEKLPRIFYIFYLVSTALMILCCLGQWLAPNFGASAVQSGAEQTVNLFWYGASNLTAIIVSIAAWIFWFTTKKAKRIAYGLTWQGGFWRPVSLMVLFLILYMARIFISVAVEGQWADYLPYWQSGETYLAVLMVLINFPLSWLLFFGEEYGWRYYLQPRLQQRFGPRLGVIVLGIVWGLWHLPLNFFFYSPETSLQSVAAQIVTCISIGIFFAYAYLKTNNIWVPVVMHFLNNNMILVVSGSANYSNQVYTWHDVIVGALIMGVLHIPFLASRVFNKEPSVE